MKITGTAVVVAVDESPASVNVIRVAVREARWRKAPLVILSAVESALREAESEVNGDGHGQVDARLIPGLAGRAIIDAAGQARAQLIVLAARSGIALLPGTMSHHVLRNARCPVLVVPAD